MAMSWKNFPFWDLSKWYRYSPPHPEEDFFGNSASKKASQKRRKRTKAVSKRASPNEPASRVGSPQELLSHATQTENANAHLAKRVYPTPAAAWAPPQAVHPAAVPEHPEEIPIHEWPGHHAGQPGTYNDPRLTANQVFNISDYRYRDPYHLTACVFHGSADGLAISNDGVHFGLSRFPFAFCRLAIFCCPPLGDNLEPQDANDLATKFASRALQNNPVVHVFMMLGDGSDAGKDQFAALEKDLTAGFLAPDVGKRYKAWNYTGVVLRWPETTSSVTWHRMAPLLRELAKQLASPSRGLSLGVALRQDNLGADMERVAANLGETYLFLLPPTVDNNNPLALRYYSQRTLAALGDLNLRFLSRSVRGRQCYLFPADTYTYRIKPPDTTHSLGPGVQGPRTNRAGRMAYFETCPMADSYSKLFTDYGVEALLNDSFLVYTEPQLLARFADYMHQSLSATCMGVWNPHMDDFGGVCGYGVYPLCGALFRYYNDTHE
ncbi:uncharacterized protein LOC119167832 [Rhipicephalus microplus]|uniref:uncharacterized protein LOC119167832 n=1 Tax=Rhipicephalus microplus TaxID=6941 RepID=UPI003F6C1118